MRAIFIRLRAQIIKELLCLLRDPKSRIVLVGPPLIQLFVFSFAVTLEVRLIPDTQNPTGYRWNG